MISTVKERIKDLVQSVLLGENNFYEKSLKLTLILQYIGIDPDREEVQRESAKLQAVMFDLEYYQDLLRQVENISRTRLVNKIEQEINMDKPVVQVVPADPKPFLERIEEIRERFRANQPDYSILVTYVADKARMDPEHYLHNEEEEHF